MEPNTSKDEEDDEDIIAAELREDTEIYCPFLQKCIAKAEGKQLTDLNRVYRFLNDKSLR